MKDLINAIFKATQNLSPIAKDRLETCLSCENKEENIYSFIVDYKLEEGKGLGCKLCKCPFATKIYAKEKENICKKWKR